MRNAALMLGIIAGLIGLMVGFFSMAIRSLSTISGNGAIC